MNKIFTIFLQLPFKYRQNYIQYVHVYAIGRPVAWYGLALWVLLLATIGAIN